MSTHTCILPDFLDVSSGNHDILHRVIACHSWKGLSKLIMAGWRNWGPEKGKDLSKVLEIVRATSRTLVSDTSICCPFYYPRLSLWRKNKSEKMYLLSKWGAPPLTASFFHWIFLAKPYLKWSHNLHICSCPGACLYHERKSRGKFITLNLSLGPWYFLAIIFACHFF